MQRNHFHPIALQPVSCIHEHRLSIPKLPSPPTLVFSTDYHVDLDAIRITLEMQPVLIFNNLLLVKEKLHSIGDTLADIMVAAKSQQKHNNNTGTLFGSTPQIPPCHSTWDRHIAEIGRTASLQDSTSLLASCQWQLMYFRRRFHSLV